MSEQKKVLLADDAHLFLELEKTFFRRENFDILTAENGAEAFDIILKDRPDIAYLDLHMPKMDGDECCLKVKEHQDLQDIPIIMVTHGGRESDLERCRAAGCDEIILKPINRHQFLSTALKFLQITDRSGPRIGIRMEIQYGADPQKLLTDYTINISEGGLFIETNSFLDHGTPLNLKFKLPNSDEDIHCAGIVAWLNHPEKMIKPAMAPGMGVQFTDLSLDTLAQMREYIKSQSLYSGV